jgi:hypothetical protein
MNTQHPPEPPSPQGAPQHYFQPKPLEILQKPIPHQGVMNTQQYINSTPPQIGKYQKPGPTQPGNLVDLNILLTNEEDIILQTHDHQYNLLHESSLMKLEASLDTSGQPFMIPLPNIEPNSRIPRVPLQWNVHNPHAREAHNYILLNDLA